VKCWTCWTCHGKGTVEEGTTTFMMDIDNCIIAIRNVPAKVCSQCGEATFNSDTSRKIGEIVDKLKADKQEVAVVDYKNMVA